jgi:DNA-directed RNA polymerase subunit M/transcription elongation factor TFIIS
MAESPRPSFHFRCPECYVGLKAAVDKVGARHTCPSCQAKIIVPDAPPEEPAPEPREEDLYATRNETVSSPEVVYIPVVCSLCHTRMHATQDQIGQTMTCPDCDTRVRVVRPAKSREEKPAFKPLEFDGATEYAIREDQRPPTEASRRAEPVEFPVVCPLCHTRMHAAMNQVGKKIVCPDCETVVVIRPPPKARAEPQPEPVEEYGVGLPAEPIYPNVVRFFEDRSEPPEEAEDDTWEFTLPSRPQGPLFSWTVNFLWHEEARIRAAWLSLGLIMILFVVACGVKFVFQYGGGMIQWLVAARYFGGAACLGVIWSFLASGIFLAVVEDTAAGAKYVASWPAASEIWSGAILFIGCALGASILPGVIVAQLLPDVGYWKWVLVPVGLYLAFPFLLLATMETDSPVYPFSGPIFQSVFTKWWAWLLFHFQVGILGAVFGGFVWVCVAYWWPWSILLLGPSVTLALMVYFRLLGRLGWHASGERVATDSDQFDRPDRRDEPKGPPAAEQAKKPERRSIPGRRKESESKAAAKQSGRPPDPKPPKPEPPEKSQGRGALDFEDW